MHAAAAVNILPSEHGNAEQSTKPNIHWIVIFHLFSNICPSDWYWFYYYCYLHYALCIVCLGALIKSYLSTRESHSHTHTIKRQNTDREILVLLLCLLLLFGRLSVTSITNWAIWLICGSEHLIVFSYTLRSFIFQNKRRSHTNIPLTFATNYITHIICWSNWQNFNFPTQRLSATNSACVSA